jgi:hypothetical protein
MLVGVLLHPSCLLCSCLQVRVESFFLYAAEHATLSKQYRPTQATPDLLKQMRSFLTGELFDTHCTPF